MSNLDVSVTLRLINQMRGTAAATELNRVKTAAKGLDGAHGTRLTAELNRAAAVGGRVSTTLRAAGAASATAGLELGRAAAAGARLSSNVSGAQSAIRGASSAAKGLASDLDRAAAAAGRASRRAADVRAHPSVKALTGDGPDRGGAGRLGAFVTPAALGWGAARSFGAYADVERRMTRVGITAEASREEMRAVTAEAQRMALATGLSFDQIARGYEALAAQGRKMKDIREFMPSVAATAQAAGADVADIANSAGAVGEQLGISAKRMQAAFDIMVKGGNEGKFELKDMARYLPSLAPAAAAAGQKGEEGLKRLVAQLQVIRNQTGEAHEAASSLQNIYTKMESKETTKHFKEFGIDLGKAMTKARAEGRDLVTVLVELADQALKGDLSKVPRLFHDMEFARGMRALLSQKGAVDAMVDTLGKADGSTLSALGRVLDDSRTKIDAMSTSWETFKTRLGEAASPAAVPLLDTLSRGLKTITDAVDEAKGQTVKPGRMMSDEAGTKLNKWANLLRYGDTLDGAPRNVAYLRSGAYRADAGEAKGRMQAEIDREQAALDQSERAPFPALRRDLIASSKAKIEGLKARVQAIDETVSGIDAEMARLDGVTASKSRFDSLRMAKAFDPKGPEFGHFPTRDLKRSLSFGLNGPPQVRPLWGDVSVPASEARQKAGPSLLRSLDDVLPKGAPGGLNPGGVRAELERLAAAAGKVKSELGADMSGAASRSMAGYTAAINAGLDGAVAAAKAKVALLTGALSFTATPTILPRLSAPAAPSGGGGGGGGTAGKGASLRGGTSGMSIQTAHFHGIRDVAGFQRQVARLTDRAARDERDGALHDIG